MTAFLSEYPPDVVAANLLQLRQYPVQTFDVVLWRRWRGVLAVQARQVRIKQGDGAYAFVVGVRWHDRREVMFPDFKLVVRGVVVPAGAGAQLRVTRYTFYPNWRSWTAAMAGAGLAAVVLFPLLWWAQGLTVGTMFVGVYGVMILSAAGVLWWAYRRAVRRAALNLLRQGVGLADPPILGWHDYLYPHDPRYQDYGSPDH